jgi:Flp pilus assembly pilin Flp
MDLITGLFVKFQLFSFAMNKAKKGQAIVEYALILFLIALVCVAALKFVGGGVNNAFSKVGSVLK